MKIRYTYRIWLLPVLILLQVRNQEIFAQKPFESEKDLQREADRFFRNKQYVQAYPLYSQLLSIYPDNVEYDFRFSVSMLYAEPEPDKAVPYLEYSSSKPGCDKEVFYHLGKGYQLTYRFREAINTYERFKKDANKKAVEELNVDFEIEQCRNGIFYLRNIPNLSVVKKTEISEDDFHKSYDMAIFRGKILVKPDDFKTETDKKKNEQSLIYLPPAANEVFFSSYGLAGGAGKDIFKVERIGEGKWGSPVNMGQVINTPSDEDFPVMHPDGKTLYFCSKGHKSMGGYDIFKSVLNAETGKWSEPVNLGFPVNSPFDDILFIATEDNRFSSFASKRYASTGKYNVFKIKADEQLLAGITVSPAEIESAAAMSETETPPPSEIKEKALLEVNTPEEPVTSGESITGITEEETTMRHEETTAADRLEEIKKLSPADLIDRAYENVKILEEDAAQTENEARTVYMMAKEQRQLSVQKANEARTIETNSYNIPDDLQRQEELQKAKTVREESEAISRQAEGLALLSDTLNRQSERKRADALEAKETARKIEQTIQSGNTTKKTYEILAEMETAVEMVRPASGEILSPSEVVLKNSEEETKKLQKELETEYENAQYYSSEITSIEEEVKNMKSEQEQTKDKTIKEELVKQVAELENEKRELVGKSERSSSRARQIEQDVVQKQQQVQNLSAAVNKVKEKSGTSAPAGVTAAADNKQPESVRTVEPAYTEEKITPEPAVAETYTPPVRTEETEKQPEPAYIREYTAGIFAENESKAYRDSAENTSKQSQKKKYLKMAGEKQKEADKHNTLAREMQNRELETQFQPVAITAAKSPDRETSGVTSTGEESGVTTSEKSVQPVSSAGETAIPSSVSGSETYSFKSEDNRVIFEKTSADESEALQMSREAETLLQEAASSVDKTEKKTKMKQAQDMQKKSDEKLAASGREFSNAVKNEFVQNETGLSDLRTKAIEQSINDTLFAKAVNFETESRTDFNDAQKMREKAGKVKDHDEKRQLITEAKNLELKSLEKQKRAEDIYTGKYPPPEMIAAASKPAARERTGSTPAAKREYETQPEETYYTTEETVTATGVTKQVEGGNEPVPGTSPVITGGEPEIHGVTEPGTAEETPVLSQTTTEHFFVSPGDTTAAVRVYQEPATASTGETTGDVSGFETNPESTTGTIPETYPEATNETTVGIIPEPSYGITSETAPDSYFRTGPETGLPSTSSEPESARNYEFTPSAETAVIPTELTSDIFAEESAPVYSEANPIPIDPPLPDGLVFKVQVGAFRKPIPQNLFGGITPVMGENTSMGFKRYTAGMFRNMPSADGAKDKLRSLGFRDAFVVAYYDGRRIGINDARDILEGKKSGAEITAIPETKFTAEKSDLTGPPVAAGNLDDLPGVIYTVQVGAYSNPVRGKKFSDVPALYLSRFGNLYRYSSGIFRDVESAKKEREKMLMLGYMDAFVTAYRDGQRITIAEVESGTVSPLDIYTPAETAVSEEKPSELQTASEISRQLDAEETFISPDDEIINLKEYSGNILYRVLLGSYKTDEEIPIPVADGILTISKIEKIETLIYPDGRKAFFAGKFADIEPAESLKDQAKKEGVKNARVVAFAGDQEVPLNQAKKYSERKGSDKPPETVTSEPSVTEPHLSEPVKAESATKLYMLNSGNDTLMVAKQNADGSFEFDRIQNKDEVMFHLSGSELSYASELNISEKGKGMYKIVRSPDGYFRFEKLPGSAIKLFMMDLNGDTLMIGIQNRQGYFMFDRIPENENVVFALSGDDGSLSNEIVITGSDNVTRKLLRGPDGLYRYSKLPASDDSMMRMENPEPEINMEAFNELLSKADNAFNSGDYEGARVYYGEAFRINPKDSYTAGRIAETDRLIKEREAKFNEAFSSAEKAFSDKDYEMAKTLYEEVLTIKPGDSRAMDRIGEIDRLIAEREAEANRLLLEIQKLYDECDQLQMQAFAVMQLARDTLGAFDYDASREAKDTTISRGHYFVQTAIPVYKNAKEKFTQAKELHDNAPKRLKTLGFRQAAIDNYLVTIIPTVLREKLVDTISDQTIDKLRLSVGDAYENADFLQKIISTKIHRIWDTLHAVNELDDPFREILDEALESIEQPKFAFKKAEDKLYEGRIRMILAGFTLADIGKIIYPSSQYDESLLPHISSQEITELLEGVRKKYNQHMKNKDISDQKFAEAKALLTRAQETSYPAEKERMVNEARQIEEEGKEYKKLAAVDYMNARNFYELARYKFLIGGIKEEDPNMQRLEYIIQ